MARGGARRYNGYNQFLNSTVESETGCLLWTKSLNNVGYAKGYMWNKTILVHRYICIASQFEDPLASDAEIRAIYDTSVVVMHSCDVRSCINPVHLQIGSHQQNTRDAVAKGRIVGRTGMDSNFARLTQEEALAIKDRGLRGDISQTALAAEFGISQQQVSRIVSGERWPNL